MRVLIINTSWTGDSTGKIAYQFHRMLKANGHSSKLVYGYYNETCADEDVIGIDTMFDIRLQWLHNQLTGYHAHYAPRANRKLYALIKEYQPDIIQLYNVHGYYIDIYRFFAFVKKRNIPIVYGMLDEHPYLGYCCYAFECHGYMTGCLHCQKWLFRNQYPRSLFWNRAKETVQLKRKAYDYDRLVFTGPKWVLCRARQSYLLKDKKLREIDEYIDTDDTFVIRDAQSLREQHHIPNDNLVILDVGRASDSRKGIHYFVELARMCQRPDITFIAIGYDKDTAGLPDNFIPVPFVRDQKLLAKYYSMADLFICTSMADTMPNTCLDSLACGTPVCGFRITGVPYVAKYPLGQFVEPKDVQALLKIIMNMQHKDAKLSQQCRDYALSRYSPQVYYDKMTALYEEMISY